MPVTVAVVDVLRPVDGHGHRIRLGNWVRDLLYDLHGVGLLDWVGYGPFDGYVDGLDHRHRDGHVDGHGRWHVDGYGLWHGDWHGVWHWQCYRFINGHRVDVLRDRTYVMAQTETSETITAEAIASSVSPENKLKK